MKKECRGLDAFDLGEVQEVRSHYVKTAKGLLKRETYYLPRDLAEVFDGSTLWFRLSPDQVYEFRRNKPPTEEEYARYSVVGQYWVALLHSLSRRE